MAEIEMSPEEIKLRKRIGEMSKKEKNIAGCEPVKGLYSAGNAKYVTKYIKRKEMAMKFPKVGQLKKDIEKIQSEAEVLYADDGKDVLIPASAMEAFGLNELKDIQRISNQYEEAQDNSLNPEEQYIAHEKNEELKEIILAIMMRPHYTLGPAMGLILRYGLIDDKYRTCEEAGKLLGVSRSAVNAHDRTFRRGIYYTLKKSNRDMKSKYESKEKGRTLPKSFTEFANLYLNNEINKLAKLNLSDEQKDEEIARLAKIQAIIDNSVEDKFFSSTIRTK